MKIYKIKKNSQQGQVNMSPALQVKLRNFAPAINKIAKHWEFCLYQIFSQVIDQIRENQKIFS